MVFNSWIFFAFFVVTYLAYLQLGRKGQNCLLLVASYFFYGFWDYRFLGLLFASTAIDFISGLLIEHEITNTRRRLYLSLSVIANLTILGFFKYFNFFQSSFVEFIASFGYVLPQHYLDIVLPVGISFYTFQSMSYVIDVYRRQLKASQNFFEFALFVSFYPQLVAGPIERAGHLLEQFLRDRIITSEKIRTGIWFITKGMFYKVFVADNLSRFVEAAFKADQVSGNLALIGIYSFAFQIYGDFAGYSLIARGISRLMGFELMVNFKEPYFALGPSDFWRRWHISLSTWLRDYLYIPLGGNRGSRFGTYSNLMLTMLLGGLWHGANYRFFLWGLYQGTVLLVFRLFKFEFKNRFLKILQCILFFQITCFGWLIFRCEKIGQIVQFPQAIFNGLDWNQEFRRDLAALLFIILPVILLDLIEEFVLRKRQLEMPLKYGSFLGIVCMYLLIFFFGARGGQPFIYFQF